MTSSVMERVSTIEAWSRLAAESRQQATCQTSAIEMQRVFQSRSDLGVGFSDRIVCFADAAGSLKLRDQSDTTHHENRAQHPPDA